MTADTILEPDEYEEFDDTSSEQDDFDTGTNSSLATVEVFDGDQGTLDLTQRQTLTRILRQRYITPKQYPLEWRTMLDHRNLIRSRLNDLMLDLHIDLDREVAYKLQVELDDTPTQRLLTDRGYTREETIILWFLRTRLRSERSAGVETAIIDRGEILERVADFRPPHATDQAQDRRAVETALGRIIDWRILYRTADAERLEISPVLETLMPLETLKQLADWLIGANSDDENQGMNDPADVTTGSDTDTDMEDPADD